MSAVYRYLRGVDPTTGEADSAGRLKRPEFTSNIKASMTSVAALAGEYTVVVQMLAFSDASWQLPRYLATMEEAGPGQATIEPYSEMVLRLSRMDCGSSAAPLM